MNLINFFWLELNGLEFATYVIIPAAIFIMIILYIYFNFKLLLIASELKSEIIEHLEDENYHYKW